MDKQRARIIWELTNKLHEKVDSLYEALMDDESTEVKSTIKEIEQSLRDINKDIKPDGKNIQ